MPKQQLDANPFYAVLDVPIWDARRSRYYRSLNEWINEVYRDACGGVSGVVCDVDALRAVLDEAEIFACAEPVAFRAILADSQGVVGVRLWPLEEPAVLALLEARARKAGAR